MCLKFWGFLLFVGKLPPTRPQMTDPLPGARENLQFAQHQLQEHTLRATSAQKKDEELCLNIPFFRHQKRHRGKM